jgi:hypothetical protein
MPHLTDSEEAVYFVIGQLQNLAPDLAVEP